MQAYFLKNHRPAQMHDPGNTTTVFLFCHEDRNYYLGNSDALVFLRVIFLVLKADTLDHIAYVMPGL